MHLELRTHAIDLSPEDQSAIERRVRFAFDRFADRIARITVSVTDTNGPRGGAANECAVHVEMRGRGRVFVREVHEDAIGASLRAIERARQSLSRDLVRRTDRRSVRYARADAARSATG